MLLPWLITGFALIIAAGLGWRLLNIQKSVQATQDHAVEIQRNLRQQLAENLLLRDALFKAVDDAVLIVDDTQTVRYANPAAEIMFEHNPVGKTLIATIRQPELEVLLEDANTICGEGVERRIEYQKHILHARAITLQHDERQISVLLLRDVTEIQRLERARREMVSNITHELGTPITNIALLAETVLSLPIKQKHRRVGKLVKDVRREADTLTHLVQEIRDLSLIESGQMPIRLTNTDLRQVVDDSILQLQALVESHNQTIVNAVETHTCILADDLKLQRAIKNILHNAIKFSGQNGNIHIAAEQRDDEIILSIRDNGPGIPADDLPRIFERFFQVDRARREGTGLGLAIVRHIALAHGGRTWAESNPGEGATFFIALVAGTPAPTPQEKATVNSAPSSI